MYRQQKSQLRDPWQQLTALVAVNNLCIGRHSHLCAQWELETYFSVQVSLSLATMTVILPTLRKQQIFKSSAREILLPPRKNTFFPIVNKTFHDHQDQVLDEVRNTEVFAGGDGHCDSAGHSAKYGTYSIVDTNTSKVIDFPWYK